VKTKWAKPTKFSAFLKKHRVGGEPALLPEHVSASDPVAVLVHSWLLWESSSEQAATAMSKLIEQRVDFNELRVSLPHEVAGIIGKRYPRVEERLHGIRRTLHDLFLRRHELSFEYLAEKGKRDVKAEVESLDGITPFVSARLLRISFDVHAMPADDQLSALLHENDVIDEPVEPEDLAGWLGTAVKADEAVAAIAAMQAAVDAAWDEGTMTKLVRRHRPLRVVEVVEVVEPVEVEEPVAEPAKPAATSEKKPAKKAPAKSAEKKAPAAKKSTAKKATAKKSTTTKAPAKKAAAKAPAKKSAAKKTAKKATSRTASSKAASATRRKAVGRTSKRSTGAK
jgi:outer membrane biosynthesis protein TonB